MGDAIFRPVRGTEEAISKMPKEDGYIYYAYDSGRIYMDKGKERIPVGGGNGAAILYANFPSDVTPNEEGLYEFSILNLLEGSPKPNENDLVLNEDGTFYKILEINQNTLICKLISVSGGGGGEGPGNIGYRTSLTVLPIENAQLINNQKFEIQFVANAEKDSEGNYTDDYVTVNWTLEAYDGVNYLAYANGVLGATTKDRIYNGITQTFDLTTRLRTSTTSRLTLIAHSPNGNINNGNSYTREVIVTTSDLTLELSTEFSNISVFSTDRATIKYNVSGNMEKFVDIYAASGEENLRLLKTERLDTRPVLNKSFNLPEFLELSHGYYKIMIKVSQAIGDQHGLSIEPLEFEIAVKDNESNKPIIWLGTYQKKYYNYDDIKIPFLVYDPENATTKVSFYKNGNLMGEPRVEIGQNHKKFSIFEIVDAEVNVRNYYSISCGENERMEKRDIDFLVEKDPNRTMELAKQSSLKLLFDAKGRSNNETSANRKDWSYNNIKASFNNFNWYNNGWVQDAQNNTCLRISNGAEFSLPIGSMRLASSLEAEQSVAIELQFKVRNIQDYTPLVHNVTRYQGDDKFYNMFINQNTYSNYDSYLNWLATQIDPETDKPYLEYDALIFDKVQKNIDTSRAVMKYLYSGTTSGMCIGTQDAFFSNGTNTVDVSFVENEMVYLTIVYSHSLEVSNRLLSIYINGVLTGVIRSTLDGEFQFGADNLVFNSTYCDLDLYKMRVYSTGLTINEVINNYAVDKKDVIIFDQNNVDKGFVIDNGNIHELQLQFKGVEQYNIDNPDKYTMPYIVFDTSMNGDDAKKLPWSKKTKVYGTVSFTNPALDRAYVNGELEELAVQDGLCKATDSAEVRAAAVKKYYRHHCPSWTGTNVEMVVQGTSSEFYPRRNYKLKTKNNETNDNVSIFLNKGPYANDFITYGTEYSTDEKTNPCHMDFFYMDNYEVGTTKFTMKIDYMESSGSYNTGFANLVANAYSKHPLETYVKNGRIVDKNGNPYEVKQSYLDSLRTSIQGFPVMAFHKRGEGDYVYIGRYNMNLDKGSDECFGFKPDKKMYVLDSEGNPQRVRDYAECWEMQNNARGYCSFRDPWNREELSFDSSGQTNPYTSYGSPLVADHIEQRYNAHDDALDGLWELNTNTSPGKKAVIWESMGWAEKVKETEPGWQNGIDYATDEKGNIYQFTNKEEIQKYDFTDNDIGADGKPLPFAPNDNLEPGRKLFLKLLENWERVSKWVWSTNTDNVISGASTYDTIALGKQKYIPGTFYIQVYNEDIQKFEFIKEEANSVYDSNKVYYEQVTITNEDGTITTLMDNAWVVNDDNLVYRANTFYIERDGVKVLDTSEEFNSAQIYYTFEPLSDEKLDELIAKGEAKHTKRLVAPITYEGTTYNYDTQEYRLAKFRNELNQHFNIEYLATYFVMTEVFECYDSRGKNAMFASWGPQMSGGDYIWYPIFYDIDTQLGINNTGIPSFEYNVDATDDGNYSTSDSILWNNFYKCFKNTYILDKYKQLRGETVTSFEAIKTPILKSVDKIEKWYRCDPEECNSIVMKGIRPLIAINLDEYYKYLTIYNPAGTKDAVSPSSPLYGLTGRISDEGEYIVETTTYHYALQGDRSLSRRQFLTNRLEYIDSWLNVGNYSRGGYNRLWGRISARRPQQGNTFLNSDRWYEDNNNLANTSYYLDNNTEAEKRYDFDSEYWATLTPVRNTYVTVQDDSAVYPAKKFTGLPLKVEFSALENGIRTAQDYNEQLCYIYGINQMKDLGSIYKMYWQEFKVEGEARKLTKILVGCDGLMTKKLSDGTYQVVLDENGDTTYIDPVRNPDERLKAYRWFNNKMNPPSMPSSSESTGMPLLKEANFSNITITETSPVLDLTSCEKLEDFRATGSNFSQIKFAPGVALNTLYLPETITTLELNEARMLNNIVEEYKYPLRQDDGSYKMEQSGLYIKGLTDATAKETKLNTLSLQGDNMGYDSYKLLSKYYNLIKALNNKNIIMTNVNWCPYTQLVEGDTYIEADKNKYYRDNGHYGLVPYGDFDNKDLFDAEILNGEVYKYNPDLEAISRIIESDDMIQRLKSQHNTRLEGIMYVNNTEALDELTVSQLNNKDNYPNLKLFYGGQINKAYSAKFVMPLEQIAGTDKWTYEYIPVSNSDELSIQKVHVNDYRADKNIFKYPEDVNYLPQKVNYDFLGWSTDPIGKENLITNKSEWEAFTIDENQYDIIFYAIFKITSYDITFKQGDETDVIKKMEYGSFVELPGNIPWIDDSTIELTETYGFKGYTSVEPENRRYHVIIEGNNIVQDITTDKVIGPRIYYPVFEKISVYDNVHPEYFTITPLQSDKNTGIIQWKGQHTVRGKLTIPYRLNNIDVVGIVHEGFAAQGNKEEQLIGITHIFWAGNPNYNFSELGYSFTSQYASFYGLSNLQYFEMPSTITAISQNCFRGCTNLFYNKYSDLTSTDCYIDTFFNNIEKIDHGAFTNAGLQNVELGKNLVSIGKDAFKTLRGSNDKTIIIHSEVLDFEKCGTGIFEPTQLFKVTVKMPRNIIHQHDWISKFTSQPDRYVVELEQLE